MVIIYNGFCYVLMLMFCKYVLTERDAFKNRKEKYYNTTQFEVLQINPNYFQISQEALPQERKQFKII